MTNDKLKMDMATGDVWFDAPAAPDREVAALAFVDVETDGLRPDCQVWEVAVVVRRPGQQEHVRTLMVDIDAGLAETRALDFGGYYDRHETGRRQSGRKGDGRPGPPPVSERAAAEFIANWTHGTYLVGVNPAFDAECLGRMLRRHGHEPGWHYHLVDVLALAAAKLQAPPPWKSDDLAARLGVEGAGDDRHTALGDAQWAARIYDAVMDGAA